MKPIYKIILASFLSIILIVTIFAGYLVSNKRVLTEYVITQINNNLNAELKIKSSDVTIFKNFPNVSLDLIGVSIVKSDTNVLNAQHVYLGFNIKDIFNKNYKIQIISIDSAIINLVVYKNGSSNFDLVKKENQTNSANENFLLDLEKVKLKNIDFGFNDLQSEQNYKTQIHEAEMDGKFKNDAFKL
ncbi:MAG: AsmA family protein, partial [Bacteroidia bacterium]